MRRLQVLPLATLLGLVACAPTEAPPPSEAPLDTAPHATEAQTDGGVESAAPVALSFQPSNLPADTTFASSEDWILDRTRCSGAEVRIDTAKGSVSCRLPNGVSFRHVTQTDSSLGKLEVAMFVARRFVIAPNMTVLVDGDRPLVVVALDGAQIQGALRASVAVVSSESAGGGGFDAVRTGPSGPGGGELGAGGSFCGLGGLGGKATKQGASYGSASLIPLLGGSGGGPNGLQLGGGGGGAVQIVSGTSIEVSALGIIDVAGGGGHTGGGGAGGAILLEAPTVSVFGTLAANGGGGSDGRVPQRGANGTIDATPAKGGSDAGSGATGGDGSAGEVVDGAAGTPDSAYDRVGSGGGGAGRIRINTTTPPSMGASATITPSLETVCATRGSLTAR